MESFDIQQGWGHEADDNYQLEAWPEAAVALICKLVKPAGKE